MEDINLLLSYLETEIMDGKKAFIGDKVSVNGEVILNLVKRIRESVNEATGVNVLRDATEKAKNIVTLAEQKRDQILDKDILIGEARAIASKIQNDALSFKAETEKNAAENVNIVWNNVKKNLSEMIKVADGQIKNLQ